MALASPSNTSRRDLCPSCWSPTDSPPPTSQDGSSNGAEPYVTRKSKEEVDHLLAKLEKEGVEIDDKITCIIDDEITRIHVEAARENISEEKLKRIKTLLTIASAAVGFIFGVKCEMKRYQRELAKMRANSIWGR